MHAEATMEQALLASLIFNPPLAHEVDVSPHHIADASLRKALAALQCATDWDTKAGVVVDQLAQRSGVEIDALLRVVSSALHFHGGALETHQLARSVRERHNRRLLIDALATIAERVTAAPIHETESELRQLLDHISRDQPATYRTNADVVAEWKEHVSQARRGDGRYLQTGLAKLDDALLGGGLECGVMHLIVAATSVGKSAMLNQIADAITAQGHPVVWATFEDSPRSSAARTIARHSELSNAKVQTGYFNGPSDYQWAVEAANAFAERPIAWLDSSHADIDRFTYTCRKAARDINAQAILIDYAQRLRASAGASIYERLVAVTQGVVRLSKETGCAVIVTSQRNTQGEANRSAKGASDLVEECSTNIMLERREKYLRTPPEHGDKPLPLVECNITKQKNAPRARLLLRWDGLRCAFSDAADSDYEEYQRAREWTS